MEYALISIIIPIYNVEKYLNRCIESIVNQTYKNLEIILVDDGSPDNCPMMCDNWAKKDTRIIVIHKINGGLSDARNYGIEKSRGKYIAFVDSDDYIELHYIEYLYELLINNNADIACCGHVNTVDDSVLFTENRFLNKTEIYTSYEICKKLLTTFPVNLVTAWGKLYKRELVILNPFPIGRICEDEATTYKYYYLSKKIVVGNMNLYAYFTNQNSIIHKAKNSINNDNFWAQEQRAYFFERKGEKQLAKYAWAKLFYSLLADSRANNGRCDKFIKQFDTNRSLFIGTRIKLLIYNHFHFIYNALYRLKGIFK